MEHVKFSEKAEILSLEEINDMQFAKLRIKAYSTALTAHGYFSTRSELKKAAKSICNKPLLVYVNPFTDDFEGHEDDGLFRKEIPCGFIPNEESANIKIEKDSDGIFFLVCDAYIWTMYFENVKSIFERDDNSKSVSVELLVIDTEEKDDGTIELKEFSFTGITLLGNKVQPAVKGAKAELIKNSYYVNTNDEYEKAKVEFEKILYNSVKQEPVSTDSFLIQKNKEETMETEIIKNSASPDVVENAVQEVSTKVEVSTDVYSYDDNGKFVGATHEEHEVRTTEVNEVPEDEVKPEMEPVENAKCSDNACKTQENECKTECNECKTQDNACKPQNNECKVDNECKEVENVCKENNECKSKNACKQKNASTVSVEEFEALKVKCSALETELSKKKNAYDALLLKCNSLEEYKNNKEKENMKNAIEIALNSVSHILSPDQIDEWRKESQKCSASNVDEFTNKLKAFAFDVQEKNGVVQKDSIRNSIPKEVENESTDFWERMARKYI